jgi:hypothetical protein
MSNSEDFICLWWKRGTMKTKRHSPTGHRLDAKESSAFASLNFDDFFRRFPHCNWWRWQAVGPKSNNTLNIACVRYCRLAILWYLWHGDRLLLWITNQAPRCLLLVLWPKLKRQYLVIGDPNLPDDGGEVPKQQYGEIGGSIPGHEFYSSLY